MTASLKHLIHPKATAALGFGTGYTRFLTCADGSGEATELAPAGTPAAEPPPRFEFSSLPDPSTLACAYEARQQLSEALASTLLLHGPITRKAPTLRLAVEALRTAQ